MTSLLDELTGPELDRIKALGKPTRLVAGERIFSEGDEADSLYFVQVGQVSLFIEKFNTKDEIRRADAGDWFGEMAMFDGTRRTACAVTLADTEFLAISRADFESLLAREAETRRKLRELVNARNEELVLKEKLIDAAGLAARDVHIGIKGDPSLRESAMLRERYESVVDRLLDQLLPRFEELLLRRTALRIMIGFNNGEIRIATLLDPFNEEFHPAARLLDDSYLDRHFPVVDYDRKAETIRGIYAHLARTEFFQGLPAFLSRGLSRHFDGWGLLEPGEIRRVLEQLPRLRSIQNFYARNVTVGVMKDVVHMQFNCDGTHIVNGSGYQRFLEENL